MKLVKFFWFCLVAVWVFLFPLAFVVPQLLSGVVHSIASGRDATIVLGVGTLLWLIFMLLIWIFMVNKPMQLKREILRISRNGQQARGTIVRKKSLGFENGVEAVEIAVQFRNLVGSDVTVDFSFGDSRPHERRYEVGNSIDLMMSTDRSRPILSLGEIKQIKVAKGGLWFLLFTLAYMVGMFLLYYALQSDGNGWRFLTLWPPHSWLMSPVIGIASFKMFLMVWKLDHETPDFEFPLYGKTTTANVTDISQTGLSVNEQPQVAITLEYEDDRGQRYQTTVKRVVAHVNLGLLNHGPQEIMYLADNPQKIKILSLD